MAIHRREYQCTEWYRAIDTANMSAATTLSDLRETYFLSDKFGIFLDAHDGSKVQSALVERLAKVRDQLNGQDAAIELPKETLVCCRVDLDWRARGVAYSVFIDSFGVKSSVLGGHVVRLVVVGHIDTCFESFSGHDD